MENNLNTNKADILVSALKSTLGIIPFAGPFLTEVVANVIPNQRIDRLTKYIKELDNKLSQISVDTLNKFLEKDEFVDLIEEGFIQASRAITDERRKYIASIVTNGITDEEINLNDSKLLLKILQEINDIEIIWLRSYLVPTISGDDEFRKKHENVLTKIYPYIEADQETIYKSAIQNSYTEHLERLQLIEQKISFDRKSGVPFYDVSTGKPKKGSIFITPLGELLLINIGLINKNEDYY